MGWVEGVGGIGVGGGSGRMGEGVKSFSWSLSFTWRLKRAETAI